MKKRCYKCKKSKSIGEFYKNKAQRDGLDTRCKACSRAYFKSYDRRESDLRYSRQPFVVENRKLARMINSYGLSKEEFLKMKKKQNGICAICPEKLEVIDHCHKTGRVRGLLCRKCNFGLGNFRDSGKLLEMAKAYLEKI